jgi:hypothetical protein
LAAAWRPCRTAGRARGGIGEPGEVAAVAGDMGSGHLRWAGAPDRQLLCVGCSNSRRVVVRSRPECSLVGGGWCWPAMAGPSPYLGPFKPNLSGTSLGSLPGTHPLAFVWLGCWTEHTSLDPATTLQSCGHYGCDPRTTSWLLHPVDRGCSWPRPCPSVLVVLL